MVKVSQIVRNLLRKSPTFAEAIGHGIVNYRALARMIKKEVEDERMEFVSHEAIAIALKRCESEQKKRIQEDRAAQPINGITLRSNIAVFSFEKSPQIIRHYQSLLQFAEKQDSPFLQYDQGMRDVNFIISHDLVPKLRELMANEKRLIQFMSCALIIVSQPHKSLAYTGVCARFFRALAWEGVNLISFFHTYGELAFVVMRRDAEKAHAVIGALAKI